MKKLLFLSLMVLVLFVSCGNKNTADNNAKTSGEIEKIQKRGKLIVGVFTDKPPFGFINEKNENDGFDIALAKQFAKDLGVELEIKDMAFDGLLVALQADKVMASTQVNGVIEWLTEAYLAKIGDAQGLKVAIENALNPSSQFDFQPLFHRAKTELTVAAMTQHTQQLYEQLLRA